MFALDEWRASQKARKDIPTDDPHMPVNLMTKGTFGIGLWIFSLPAMLQLVQFLKQVLFLKRCRHLRSHWTKEICCPVLHLPETRGKMKVWVRLVETGFLGRWRMQRSTSSNRINSLCNSGNFGSAKWSSWERSQFSFFIFSNCKTRTRIGLATTRIIVFVSWYVHKNISAGQIFRAYHLPLCLNCPCLTLKLVLWIDHERDQDPFCHRAKQYRNRQVQGFVFHFLL